MAQAQMIAKPKNFGNYYGRYKHHIRFNISYGGHAATFYQQGRIWYEDMCCKMIVEVSDMKDPRHQATYFGAAREQGRYGVALRFILV